MGSFPISRPTRAETRAASSIRALTVRLASMPGTKVRRLATRARAARYVRIDPILHPHASLPRWPAYAHRTVPKQFSSSDRSSCGSCAAQQYVLNASGCVDWCVRVPCQITPMNSLYRSPAPAAQHNHRTHRPPIPQPRSSEAGTYAPTAQDGQCLECSPGFATGSAAKATQCSACDPGFFSAGLSVNCSECEPGTSSGARSSECSNW